MNSLSILLLIIALILSTIIVFLTVKCRKKKCRFDLKERIIDSIPETIFVYDENFILIDILNVDPKLIPFYNRNEFIGKNITELCQDKNMPTYEACNLTKESMGRLSKENPIGRIQYVITNYHFEATNRYIDGIYLSIVHNVTNVVLSQNEYMRKSKNELSIALTAGGLTSWCYDRATNAFTSAHYNEMIGSYMAYDDLIKKIHPAYRKEVITSIDKLLSGESEMCEFMVKILDDNGVMLWDSVKGIPHEYDENGCVKSIIGSQKDVTRDENVKNELIRLRNISEESNRLKSAFLANMSHEIRTPLNAIVGFSSLIPIAKDENEVEQYLGIIEQNNDMLLNVINDILDLSKIESGKIDFSYSLVNIYNLTQQLIYSIKLKVGEKVKVVMEDHLDQEMEIFTDGNRVSQVITNYLTNAAKFTREGSITIGYKSVGSYLYFYVKDTGIGIAKENLNRVFVRFVKLNEFAQGTGLGLSICKTIIELMGGQVGADSEPKKGSTFWFTLPNSKSAATANIPKNKNEIASVLDNKKPKVLIVQDHLDNYMIYDDVLSDYEVLHAWNVEFAITLINRHNPKIVLMDVYLPESDNQTAISLMRNVSKDLPIIGITLSSDLEEQDRNKFSIYTDLISLSHDKSEISKTIQRYIN